MADPESFARGYFPRLATLGECIETTEKDGGAIPFSDGVERAISLIRQQASKDKKVLFIGNGGSAGVASHQAIDYWRNGGVPALAFNDGALLTCIGNDFGFEHTFSKPIAMFANEGDVLFAISSSGQSENILEGAREGLRKGCHVITLSAFQPDNPLRSRGALNFFVPTMKYGYAEILHLCLCHCILEGFMELGRFGGGLERE